MSTRKFDVIVVGAGLAGSTVVQALARYVRSPAHAGLPNYRRGTQP